MLLACWRGDRPPCPEETVTLLGGEEFGAASVADEELDADLVTDEELDADPVPEEELDVDLDVDEDESSACAPYLARQMSCLGSRTPGVKDTPFLGSARGAKEAGRRLTREQGRQVLRRWERADNTEGHTELPRFRPPGG